MQSTLRHDRTTPPEQHYQAEGILELWHAVNSIADFEGVYSVSQKFDPILPSFQPLECRIVAARLLEIFTQLLASSSHALELQRSRAGNLPTSVESVYIANEIPWT